MKTVLMYLSKQAYKNLFLLFILIVNIFLSCQSPKLETPTRGDVCILVDNTFLPMIEDQVEVFESQYKYAHLIIRNGPEKDIADWLLTDSSRIALLPRLLTASELAYFASRKMVPKTTNLAVDAIALIVHKDNKDTLLSISDLKLLLTGQKSNSYTLVFDSYKSSIVQYMLGLAGLSQFRSKGIYSLSSHQAVIQYVAENENTIGFVGVNWLYQASPNQQKYVDQVKVLNIGEIAESYQPTQDHIASQKYPFVRTIVAINCETTAGLGLGFSTFVAGDVGQRIILKSGLVPITYPKRELIIRSNL